jgi:hypothetical protein
LYAAVAAPTLDASKAVSRRAIPRLLVAVVLVLAAACSSRPAADQGSRDTPADAHLFEGFHDAADCGSVVGWARDKYHPESHVAVDVYDGIADLGSVMANEMREDLRAAGTGDGSYGFRFALPLNVVDGRVHVLHVRVSGTDVALTNTPKSVTCDYVQRPSGR